MSCIGQLSRKSGSDHRVVIIIIIIIILIIIIITHYYYTLRFTKRLVGFCKYSHDESCTILGLGGLERLELRRLHAVLIYCFNIIHDFTNLFTKAH